MQLVPQALFAPEGRQSAGALAAEQHVLRALHGAVKLEQALQRLHHELRIEQRHGRCRSDHRGRRLSEPGLNSTGRRSSRVCRAWAVLLISRISRFGLGSRRSGILGIRFRGRQWLADIAGQCAPVLPELLSAQNARRAWAASPGGLPATMAAVMAAMEAPQIRSNRTPAVSRASTAPAA